MSFANNAVNHRGYHKHSYSILCAGNAEPGNRIVLPDASQSDWSRRSAGEQRDNGFRVDTDGHRYSLTPMAIGTH